MLDFNQIKKEIEDYSLDEYNVELGWKKLRRRAGGRRNQLIIMVTTVAAACVIIVAGTWLLEQSDTTEKGPVAVHQPKTKVLPSKDTAGAKKGMVVSKLRAAEENAVVDAPDETKRQLVYAAPEKNTIKESVPTYEAEPTGSNRTNAVITEELPDDGTMPPQSQARTETWEVINEQELRAMVMIPEEPKKKSRKLLAFFAANGEQTEYTNEKLSSMPSWRLQINF